MQMLAHHCFFNGEACCAACELLCVQDAANGKHQRSEWRDALMLSVPAVFDLIATVLVNIGLLTVTASVSQMMRGAEVRITATSSQSNE